MTTKLAAQVQAKRQTERQSRFDRVSINHIGEIPVPEYIIKDVLYRYSLALLYGPTGCGKTFFVIALASSIAAGLPWRGKRLKQGLVIYVAAEAGRSIFKRFKAWVDANIGEANEDLIPLEILGKGPNLLDPEQVGQFLQELYDIQQKWERPISLVVVDTLSRSISGGDENSSGDMTRAIGVADQIRDEFGAATLVIHHTGKNIEKGSRGFSGLPSAADTIIHVSDRTATIEKQRDGEEGERFGFSLDVVEMGTDEDGDPITTCVAVPADAPKSTERTPKAPGSATVALQALQEAILNNGEQLANTSTIPPNTRGVRLDDWRAQFKIRYGEDKADISNRGANKAFTAGKDWLHKWGKIGVSDSFVWLT